MKLLAKDIVKSYLREGKSSNILTAVAKTYTEFSEGCLHVISGRSGSGKSTFINMLSGILPPSEGRVLYGNEDIYAMNDLKLSAFRNKHIGYIPQGQSAIASLNVGDNILLPFTLYNEKPDRAYADELMELLQISSLRTELPSSLSGGEIRRVAIARALIKNPDFIFADEPTGDLDDENTETVFRLLSDTAHKKKATVILVTHEASAGKYADREFMMSSGVLKEVYRNE